MTLQGTDAGSLLQNLPTLLPNASRVLLAACDMWLQSSDEAPAAKIQVLQSLAAAINEKEIVGHTKVESIPYLIRTEDPPRNWVSLLSGNAPPLSELLG